jgi:hypothetical protein
MKTEILTNPLTRDQLLAISWKHNGRVQGVLAFAWYDLVQHDQQWFDETSSCRITGSKYGLADIDARVVGCLRDEVFLEVSGDVSLLLENYDDMLAAEATPEVGERMHGVDVAQVVALAKRQIVEAGLHLRAGSFSELHDVVDANMLGFCDDGEHLADGTAFADLGVERAVEVMNRVQSIVDAWLRSGQARRDAEGGGHAS